MVVRILLIAAGVCELAGAFLPWATKNGIIVNGFSDVYRWRPGAFVIITGLLFIVYSFLNAGKFLRRALLTWSMVSFLISFHYFWQGWKLDAIGAGSVLILLGVIGGAAGVVFKARE